MRCVRAIESFTVGMVRHVGRAIMLAPQSSVLQAG